MIRPRTFYPNPETAADNAFQREARGGDPQTISARAQKDFDGAVECLRDAGVTVHVFEDTAPPEKPDAVFPNNWFSTHHDGRIVLYPMYSPSRRAERRHDMIEALKKIYHVRAVIDYSPGELLRSLWIQAFVRNDSPHRHAEDDRFTRHDRDVPVIAPVVAAGVVRIIEQHIVVVAPTLVVITYPSVYSIAMRVYTYNRMVVVLL